MAAAASVHTELIVVAIDIGTSYSGYAFSFRSEYERDSLSIHTHEWPFGAINKYKTSSAILLSPNKELYSFGCDAEKIVADWEEGEHPDELNNYFYIDTFKMQLYNTDVSNELLLWDITGQKELPAIDVFKAAIKFMKDHFEKNMKQRGFTFYPGDVRWVITVPSVWSNQAKQFMREASNMAGIENHHLTLCYEPEAAALYCKKLPPDQRQCRPGQDMFAVGNKIMVIDLGGGTADFSVQEVTSSGKMRSIRNVSGGPWGGCVVMGEFKVFIDSVFGTRVMKKFIRHNLSDYIEFLRDIEMKKMNAKAEDDAYTMLRFPHELRNVFEKINSTKLESSQTLLENDVTITRGKLKFKSSKMRQFFAGVLDSILNFTVELLKTHNDVNSILLVGGFSESEVVQKTLKSKLTKCDVIIPVMCGISVLKGAVMYGYSPEAISARYCPFTFGIALNRPYNPSLHVGGSTFRKNDKLVCEDCFEKFFTIGEIVNVGDVRSVDVHSVHKAKHGGLRTDVKEIKVYTSIKTDPLITRGCSMHALIIIEPPDGIWPEVVDGKIEMEVGDVEIIVRYRDKSTGNVKLAFVDFYNHESKA